MLYRPAIFDLDGTLADSFPFFISTFNQLAEKHAFKRIQLEEVDGLRRYSARELMAHFGIPMWKMPLVARSFTSLMQDNVHAVPLFDGVPNALAALAARDMKLAVVSSNSRENVMQVLGPSCAHFRYLDCGASIFGKAARLRKVMRNAGVSPDQSIYIGDQPTDYEAAKAVNMAFGLVSWGYASVEAFDNLKPDAQFLQVSDFLWLGGSGARSTCLDNSARRCGIRH